MTGKGKAIVINDWWAGIISTLAVAAILGGFGFCKVIYDAQAEADKDRAVIKTQTAPIIEARLPEKMAEVKKAVENMEKRVNSMDYKLDLLIEQQIRTDERRGN